MTLALIIGFVLLVSLVVVVLFLISAKCAASLSEWQMRSPAMPQDRDLPQQPPDDVKTDEEELQERKRAA